VSEVKSIMKAQVKVLAGVAGVILLTASVVVGFFQQAFLSQKSNPRGRGHSLSQVGLSAGKIGADDLPDLSSLLETAKSELGGASSNMLGETAPSLGDFVKTSVVERSIPNLATSADWQTTKANLDILKSNTIKFTGADPSSLPKFSVPDFPKFSASDLPAFSVPDFSGFSSSDIGGFDASPIQQYIESQPLTTAVAAGASFLLIAAKQSKKPKKVKDVKGENIQATAVAIGDITDELGTLQARMKALEATGFDLDSQLSDAKTQLTERVLDVSKERLKVADTSLILNREIDMLKQKLTENDRRVKNMDEELSKAKDDCLSLVDELEKSRKEQAKKNALEAADIAKMADELGKKKAVVVAAAKKQAALAAKLAKKAPAQELPTADAPFFTEAKVAAPPKKKALAKKAAANEGDLTTLTKSGLSRTTVKVLAEFLDSKGVTTVDENGKTLKKAVLVEAVQSL